MGLLRATLPSHALPDAIVALPRLPRAEDALQRDVERALAAEERSGSAPAAPEVDEARTPAALEAAVLRAFEAIVLQALPELACTPNADTPLMQAGIDSFGAVSLAEELRTATGALLPPTRRTALPRFGSPKRGWSINRLPSVPFLRKGDGAYII